jgi:hypothetical protein
MQIQWKASAGHGMYRGGSSEERLDRIRRRKKGREDIH